MNQTKPQALALLKMKTNLENWFDGIDKCPVPYVIRECSMIYDCILHDTLHSCATICEESKNQFEKCNFRIIPEGIGWNIMLP